MTFIDRRLEGVALSPEAEAIHRQICQNDHPCIKLEGTNPESITRIQKIFYNILRTETGLKLVSAITSDQYPQITIAEDNSDFEARFDPSLKRIYIKKVPTSSITPYTAEKTIFLVETQLVHELLHFLDMSNKHRSKAEGAAQEEYEDYNEQLVILEGVLLPDGSRISEHTFCDDLALAKRFHHSGYIIHPSYFKKENDVETILYLMRFYLKMNLLAAFKMIYEDHKEIIGPERLLEIISSDMDMSIDKRELFDMPTWKKILQMALANNDKEKIEEIFQLFIETYTYSPKLTDEFFEMIVSDRKLVKLLTNSTDALELALYLRSPLALKLFNIKQNWTENELKKILVLAYRNNNSAICSNILEKKKFTQAILEELYHIFNNQEAFPDLCHFLRF